MVLHARDIVESDFISLDGETSALDAALLMKERHHGFVIVSSEGRPCGIVTEWDYVTKIVANEKNPQEVRLKQISSDNLVTVEASETFDQVSKLMVEKGIRRIPVLDGGKLIGVITSKTLLMRLEEYINTISSQIARLIAPFLDQRTSLTIIRELVGISPMLYVRLSRLSCPRNSPSRHSVR